MLAGGCYCGKVRYASTSAPSISSMCHCRMCQRWTGAPAAMTVCFALDDFRWENEEPKSFPTSSILNRQFCANCGTSLGYRYKVGRFSASQFILVGTLDDPNSVEGPRHYFGIEDHLEKWLPLQDGRPTYRADTNPYIRQAFDLVKEASPD
jgi:hypothetical protein